MVEHHILERMVHDVRWLLLNEEEQAAEPEAVYLWDSKIGTVANGVNYFDAEEGEEHRCPDYDKLSAQPAG